MCVTSHSFKSKWSKDQSWAAGLYHTYTETFVCSDPHPSFGYQDKPACTVHPVWNTNQTFTVIWELCLDTWVKLQVFLIFSTVIYWKCSGFGFQSYEKQGFHSGTPPPFNLPGSQNTPMGPSGAYAPHLFIPAMAPQQHHSTPLMHQPLHQVTAIFKFRLCK
jgi:hypothetical protein